MYQSLREEVHLWLFSCSDFSDEKLGYYLSLLSDDEKARIDGAKSEHRRRELLVSRGALREMLGLYLSMDPSSIVFEYNACGKPSLATPNQSGLEFNLSHSGDRLVIALTRDRQLGVDLERINPEMAEETSQEVVFTEEERRELASLPSDLALQGFFTAWTRKEAFIKATGEGFSADLQSFTVTVDPRKPAELWMCDGTPLQDWRIESLDLFPGYASALAVRGRSYRVASSSLRQCVC
jgi:4'-phosphopantetheinyl transferase